MSQESIVYGCIKDAPRHSNTAERMHINRRVILTLPKDEEWPFLSQNMFSLPQCDNSQTNAFQSPIIHFGAAYKAIEYEWDEWIIKFENLLNRMYWVSATAHLETELFGSHSFNWHMPGGGGVPGSQSRCIRCQWVQEFANQR